MTDTVDPARSRQMALVRGKDTKPEMAVRRLAHALGYRFRLHRKDLPGRPDLVFPSRRAAVLVHGCFWHRHDDQECRLARLPKSRPEFWIPKLEGNRQRDFRNVAALEAAGWRVLMVWECQLRDTAALADRLKDFLGPPGRSLA
ncbi:very short patch repair endonuclease [Aureimonas sp. SA4125]|uniref:very short patch repair endonuclease n=1 Tax=Aureimonas sp. SA4125 TaxID=2826993 RepID=UPI001CC74613|nr:DNA mismatch endonuclease Vsr [Aureimonas sp. SA4125]BDA85504.1 very short patch repair endonuclease [Aureimonas sp. SA4125]